MTAPNTVAHSAGAVCCRSQRDVRRHEDRGDRATWWVQRTVDAVRERPRIHADRDHDGRWLVEHQGHVYPFPRWDSAVTAALKPRHLCRFACICPVRGRESR